MCSGCFSKDRSSDGLVIERFFGEICTYYVNYLVFIAILEVLLLLLIFDMSSIDFDLADKMLLLEVFSLLIEVGSSSLITLLLIMRSLVCFVVEMLVRRLIILRIGIVYVTI